MWQCCFAGGNCTMVSNPNYYASQRANEAKFFVREISVIVCLVGKVKWMGSRRCRDVICRKRMALRLRRPFREGGIREGR